MSTDDLFGDDYWYDDDGYAGYIPQTIDPGPWMNVAVAGFCLLSLLLLPFFVTLGRKYERKRIRETEQEEEDDPAGASGAPLASREEKNMNGARSEISRAPSSYIHGKSTLSGVSGAIDGTGKRLQNLVDRVVMPPYPDDVDSHVAIPTRIQLNQQARSEIAAYRAHSEAGFRARSEAAYSANTASARTVTSSLMVGSTTMLDTGGAYRNRRAGVRRYRRALKEKQWREEQKMERQAEEEGRTDIYSQLLQNAHIRRGQRDHDVGASSRSRICDDSASLASFSVMSKLEDVALSPCDAVDAHDNVPLLHEHVAMAGDEEIDLCCGERALWRPTMIGAAFDRLLVVAEWDREMKRIVSLAIPFSFSSVASGVFDVIRVGLVANYIGTDAVAAYTIVDLILGITEEFFGGFVLTESSLCSQSIGCKNFKLAGEYVQISSVLYTLFMIPNMLVWWFFTYDVAKLFRFSDETATMAQEYAHYYLFMQLMEGYDGGYSALLEVTGHERWTTAVGILSEIVATCVMVALMLTQTVTLTDIGIIELAITILFFGLNVVFTLWFGWMEKFTQGLFCSCALRNTLAVKTVIRTALPLAFGQLLQYGEWELLTFFVGVLGPAEVTAWGIAGAVWDTLETLTEGFGDAGEIRVAFHLGSGMPAKAKLASYKTILVACICATVFTSVLWIVGEDLAKLLTPDPTLQRLLIEVLPLMGIGNIALTAGSVSWALVGAQGRYRLATCVVFVSSWLVTLPLAAVLTIALKVNLEGVAGAVVIGFSVAGTTLLYILIRSDWERLSRIVVELNASMDPSDSSSESESDDDEESFRDESSNAKKRSVSGSLNGIEYTA